MPIRSMAARNNASAPSSPKNSRSSARGTPKRNAPPAHGAASRPLSQAREKGSPSSTDRASCHTVPASTGVAAKIETQSSDRQAGTTPAALRTPRVGFNPTRLLKAAGTRPEPAESVPSENEHSPFATAIAQPELEPPEM